MTISLTHWNKEQDNESPLRWSHFRSVPQVTTWRHETEVSDPISFRTGIKDHTGLVGVNVGRWAWQRVYDRGGEDFAI